MAAGVRIVREERGSWAVVDEKTGQPVTVGDRVQTGLTLSEAARIEDALVQQDRAARDRPPGRTNKAP